MIARALVRSVRTFGKPNQHHEEDMAKKAKKAKKTAKAAKKVAKKTKKMKK